MHFPANAGLENHVMNKILYLLSLDLNFYETCSRTVELTKFTVDLLCNILFQVYV